MRIRYIDKKFSGEHQTIVIHANQIIDEYAQQGYSLTLRQIYYQFVARGLLENKQSEYNRLGNIISDARMAGLMDWHAIEDRTRGLKGLQTYEHPTQLLQQARENYRMDLWADQPYRPEVWVEKEALAGVVEGICAELRVNFFSCRGYNSQSEQWRAGQRFHNYILKGQTPIVLHLGDHDPSGLDMTRDNRDRLGIFAGSPITVVRLALNRPQIDQYNPPPNPAKLSDSRAEAYIAEHGDSSWELDALSPAVLTTLIKDAVARVRDESLWSAALAQEAGDKNNIDMMIENLSED